MGIEFPFHRLTANPEAMAQCGSPEKKKNIPETNHDWLVWVKIQILPVKERYPIEHKPQSKMVTVA